MSTAPGRSPQTQIPPTRTRRKAATTESAFMDGQPPWHFVLDAGAIKDAYVLDYTWRVGAKGTGTVSWQLVEAEQVLKALDGSYTLSGPPQGPTTVTYQLAVDVRIPMLGLLKRKAEKSIIATALQELKKRAEG